MLVGACGPASKVLWLRQTPVINHRRRASDLARARSSDRQANDARAEGEWLVMMPSPSGLSLSRPTAKPPRNPAGAYLDQTVGRAGAHPDEEDRCPRSRTSRASTSRSTSSISFEFGVPRSPPEPTSRNRVRTFFIEARCERSTVTVCSTVRAEGAGEGSGAGRRQAGLSYIEASL